MISIGMFDWAKPPYPPAPLYEQVLIGVFMPPIMSAFLCLMMKLRGKEFGTSNSRVVRNSSDWVAFLTFTGYFYVLVIGLTIYYRFR
jgi:hypothetical protein